MNIAPSPNWKNGWKGRKKWLRQYLNQHGRCLMCDREFLAGELTKDHRIPLSKCGSTQWENIQLLCRSCNEEKADTIENADLELHNATRPPE